ASRRPAARLRLPEAERLVLRLSSGQGHGAAGARLAPARRGHPRPGTRRAGAGGCLRPDRRGTSTPLLRAERRGRAPRVRPPGRLLHRPPRAHDLAAGRRPPPPTPPTPPPPPPPPPAPSPHARP